MSDEEMNNFIENFKKLHPPLEEIVTEEERQDIINKITEIPAWVKTPQDLINLCHHLRVKLMKANAVCKLLQSKIPQDVLDETTVEASILQSKYERVYNSMNPQDGNSEKSLFELWMEQKPS